MYFNKVNLRSSIGMGERPYAIELYIINYYFLRCSSF